MGKYFYPEVICERKEEKLCKCDNDIVKSPDLMETTAVFQGRNLEVIDSISKTTRDSKNIPVTKILSFLDFV